MEVVNKKLVLVLIIIGIISGVFIWQSISDNKTKLEIVSLNNETKSSSMFAIMLEQIDEEGNLTYVESEDNTWPTDDTYVYDITKSGCMDANGNKIENALEYDLINNIASVKTEKTSYCYLYFKITPNLHNICKDFLDMKSCTVDEYMKKMNEIPNLSSEEIGGMKRYQGINEKVHNNYICFGVSSLEECLGDNYISGIYDESKFSKYLYRIIGITSNGQLKLIKKEALESKMQWYDSQQYMNIPWYSENENRSFIYDNLNGEYFLNDVNNDYVPAGWENKILDVEWKYGDTSSRNNYNGDTAFNIENNFENVTELTKIGLMYLHDYYYAYGGDAQGVHDNAKQAWIHLAWNDATNLTLIPYFPTTEPLTTSEWVLTRYGLYGSYYCGWIISSSGRMDWVGITSSYVVRPVFYLTSDVKIISGDGTATNPYIII